MAGELKYARNEEKRDMEEVEGWEERRLKDREGRRI